MNFEFSLNLTDTLLHLISSLNFAQKVQIVERSGGTLIYNWVGRQAIWDNWLAERLIEEYNYFSEM